MVPRGSTPRGDQTWRTFVCNHAREIWACDFLTQCTALFAVAYVFVIMEVGSRRIVHVNVTSNPTLPWVKQQLREATAWDETPRFLIHDNDGIFGQLGRSVTVEEAGRRRRYRCHLDRWLDRIMQIEGLPIPYGAPNASPHVERFMRTLRQEALNHFLFLSTGHIRRVVREYIRFYNGARPSQAVHGIPDPYPELKQPPPQTGRLVALPVLGGVQHDYRLVAWRDGACLPEILVSTGTATPSVCPIRRSYADTDTGERPLGSFLRSLCGTTSGSRKARLARKMPRWGFRGVRLLSAPSWHTLWKRQLTGLDTLVYTFTCNLCRVDGGPFESRSRAVRTPVQSHQEE